jgi:hypothetical protein
MSPADRIAIRVHECASIAALVEEHAQSELSNLILATRLGALQDALSDCDDTDTLADPEEGEEDPEEEAEEEAAEEAAEEAEEEDAEEDAEAEDRADDLQEGEAAAEADPWPDVSARPAEEAPAPAPPPPEADEPPIPPEALRGQLTEARARVLMRMWPDLTHDMRDIHQAMLAHPGPPMPNSTAIYGLAQRLGLPTRRSEAYAQPAEADAPAAPEPTTAEGVLASVPADDLAEARRMLAAGKIGAKGLHEYFGWPMLRAQAIAEAIRAEAMAAAQGRAA